MDGNMLALENLQHACMRNSACKASAQRHADLRRRRLSPDQLEQRRQNFPHATRDAQVIDYIASPPYESTQWGRPPGGCPLGRADALVGLSAIL